MNYCYIDFEYNNAKEEKLNLVCCSYLINTEITSIWLHNDSKAQQELKDTLLEISKDHIFVAFNVIAEGRSFISLGIDPVQVKWVDLQVEYKMLLNGNNELSYGHQLINGNPLYTYNPALKSTLTKDEIRARRFDRPQKSLAACVFKLLNKKINTAHKDSMRDLILLNKDFYMDAERHSIIKYCESDVFVLPEIQKKMKEYSLSLEGQLYRGKAVAIHANIENYGYPIDYKATKKFSDSHREIMNKLAREMNFLFPEILPFKFVRTLGKYTLQTKNLKKWILENHKDDWELTPKGEYSLKLECWTDKYNARHNYKKDSFGEQIVRYLKIKSSLNGLQMNKNKSSFWDYVGKDERVRPWLNPYGSSTSRTQPKAVSFLFLRPAWQRSLVKPKRGKTLGTIDYQSCEFLISGLMSKCQKMVEAYKSLDPYLFFAKEIGLVPPNGTKEEYKRERDICKSCVLGISYGLTCVGLAKELTKILGEEVTEEYAQQLIDHFFEVYPEYKHFREDTILKYRKTAKLELPDHWVLSGGVNNDRSVQNFPIQGTGATILRKALMKCYERKLNVIFTLHDAIYIEFDRENERAMENLYDCMYEAFVECFPDDKENASLIRLDGKIWGEKYVKNQIVELKQFDVEASNQYLDERGIAEYREFKPFLSLYNVEI